LIKRILARGHADLISGRYSCYSNISPPLDISWSMLAPLSAVAAASSKIVSPVLLDLQMPGMDGFEFIRHVREQETLKELPILIMTAKTLAREEIALLRRDTQALLQKNGNWRQQLMVEVRRVLQGRKRAKSAGQP
jgi:DNA-binding response OmpR family regulator